jgi:hypothetical protein
MDQGLISVQIRSLWIKSQSYKLITWGVMQIKELEHLSMRIPSVMEQGAHSKAMEDTVRT